MYSILTRKKLGGLHMSQYTETEKEELAKTLKAKLNKRLVKGYEIGMALFTLADNGDIEQEDVMTILKKVYGGNATNASRVYVMARELMSLEPAPEKE